MPETPITERIRSILRALIGARRLWRVCFVLYTILVLCLTLWPNLQVPGPVRTDLVAHFTAFGTFTIVLGLTRWFGPIGSLEALLLTFICASGFSIVDEAAQSHPYFRRTCVPDDLIANLGGVALGLVATVVLRLLGPAGARTRRNIEVDEDRPDFVKHARTFLLLTLASRVFGLTRDAVFAAVFGASAIASAFFTAFLIPNVFRRLFGEGALAAAFIPRYTQLREEDPGAADRFASITVIVSLSFLCAVAALGELGLWIALRAVDQDGPMGGTGDARGVITMTMIMLPFMPLVCGTAVLGGMLQTLGRFGPTAGAPIILNTCMISALAASAWIFGLGHPKNLPRVAAWLSVGVTLAGALQLLWCVLALRGNVRWTRDVRPALGELRGLGMRMLPVVIGLGTAQIGLLIDATIAGWPVLVGDTIAGRPYPLDTGSASILYYAQRLYQLPLGVFAIAIATAVFPELSRLVNDGPRFGETLRKGLRTTLFIGIPAAVGLIIVREELVTTIYGGASASQGWTGRAFVEADAQRVARTLLAYAPAVFAAGATHVFTRAFYAHHQTRTPMWVGIGAVVGNVVLSLALMWSLREQGVALASSICAIVQACVLALLISKRAARDGWRIGDPGLYRSIALTVVGAALMAPTAFGAMALVRRVASDGRPGQALVLGAGVAAGAGTYLVWCLVLRRPEVAWLLGHSGRRRSP
ncbi:MAG: murein biosynthesis integral membrane protein MurJ [Phycisphaerales bacterium]|nr:murein biosynthesis integral membrane protein MurJ [Phycisphaerales bacterium]